MIIVYGADWCEDTRRSRRHLRRLGVAHRYINIDEDLDALARAKALNDGRRRTPTIDLGLGGSALVEPDNDTLTGALVEMDMLTEEDAHERLGVQNVGDFERVLRTGAGVALAFAGCGVAALPSMAVAHARRRRRALRAHRVVPALSVRQRDLDRRPRRPSRRGASHGVAGLHARLRPHPCRFRRRRRSEERAGLPIRRARQRPSSRSIFGPRAARRARRRGDSRRYFPRPRRSRSRSNGGPEIPMARVHDAGVFEGKVPGGRTAFPTTGCA